MVYCELNDIVHSELECQYGNIPTFKNCSHGYTKFCAPKCQCFLEHHRNALIEYNENLSDEERQKHWEKWKQTNLEKYGVEHASQSEEVKEKAKQTTMEKYGVEHASQSEEVKDKIKQTTMEKYGVEHTSQRKILISLVDPVNYSSIS